MYCQKESSLENEPDGHDQIDSLPDACLDIITNLLDTRSKANFKLTCTKVNVFSMISLNERLGFALHDIISNIGINYDLFTSMETICHTLHISYLLNIYTNSAIFFQKVKTHKGLVLYNRLLTLDRRNLDMDKVHEIVNIFMSTQPIVTRSTNHFKVLRFLKLINNIS